MFLSFKRHTFDVCGRRFGVESSRIGIRAADGTDVPYLHRWIIYFNNRTLRLHKFYRGDDDRASHTHPWKFWTFPLRYGYCERIYDKGVCLGFRLVEPWRWHKRDADFEHFVVHGVERYTYPEGVKGWASITKPFYTIVVTGPMCNDWGFYPKPNQFIGWRDYDG